MVLLVIILRLLSYLPLGVLYWISDITAFLLAHVIKYRSEVIKRNLSHAFPDLNPQQQRILMREFYKYLSDQLVETIKLQRLTRDQLSKRIHYVNPELMNRLINEKKNIVILMGHCGNWEWAGAATAFSFNAPTFPVYRKVKSPSFNSFYLRLRSRFGSTPILDKNCIQELSKVNSNFIVAMLADQSPRGLQGEWVDFLNQETCFFRGPEVLAKRIKNTEVILAQIRRNGRGKYAVYFELPTQTWKENQGNLLINYAHFLEKEILQDPVNWLWSHNRWKTRQNQENA